MSKEIHSEFRHEARLATTAGVLITIAGCFFLFWGAVLTAIAAGFLPGFGSLGPSLPAVGWLLVIACLASGILLMAFARHLLLVFPSWLRRASWLLAHAQPRNMFLDFDPAVKTRGREAVLREENGSGAGETIEIRSPLWKFRDLEPMSVGVCREAIPDGIVVIFAGGGVLWGFRTI
ncbi:MAG: hypothetical protein ABFD98_17555 [Syntrophobacteraceae bacterium]|nr:hypothetical protein [Desulfobacteraceae bacterium]